MVATPPRESTSQADRERQKHRLAEDSIETTATIKTLQKENRILRKKLERTTANLQHIEETKRNKESLLKTVIRELEQSQQVLERKSSDLEMTLEELRKTQERLVESEKLSALGQLVAGVAHEINTPVGTSITVASTLADETASFSQILAEGGLRKSQLTGYMAIAQESCQLLSNNLQRAGELIQNFKQVAVDQAHLEQRCFALKAYSEQVFQSLSPQLHNHQWEVTGDEITLYSYPGLLAQVLTNLITNSITHAYGPDEPGQLRLTITQWNSSEVELCYSDDGKGIAPELIARIYEPFFTTARNQGGTGLGLHILHNLITQHLQGQIQVKSELGHGTHFSIQFPIPPEAITSPAIP